MIKNCSSRMKHLVPQNLRVLLEDGPYGLPSLRIPLAKENALIQGNTSFQEGLL